MLELVLYSRQRCHLCEVMLGEIRALTRGRELRVSVLDVDSDPELVRRFGADVPVLFAGDQEVCRHRLDREALARLLDARSR